MALFSILSQTAHGNATRWFEWSFVPVRSYARQLNIKTSAWEHLLASSHAGTVYFLGQKKHVHGLTGSHGQYQFIHYWNLDARQIMQGFELSEGEVNLEKFKKRLSLERIKTSDFSVFIGSTLVQLYYWLNQPYSHVQRGLNWHNLVSSKPDGRKK